MNNIEIIQRTKQHWGYITKLKNYEKRGVKAFLLDSMGTDHFPVAIAKEMGFEVRWLPDYCSDEVSDFAIVQLFLLKRKIHPNFPENTANQPCLVIGSEGNIGKLVCVKFSGLGMDVLNWDVKLGFDEQILLDWLGVAKVIVFCCDLNVSTKHFLKTKHFKLMRNKPFIINPVGRLGLVSLKLIKKYLDKEVISGYACDEKIRGSLSRDSRCLFTPHQGWKSIQSKNKREKFLKRIKYELEHNK